MHVGWPHPYKLFSLVHKQINAMITKGMINAFFHHLEKTPEPKQEMN